MSSNQEFPLGFSSNMFYVLALFPAVVAVSLGYAGTRMSPPVLYFGLAALIGALAVLFAFLAYSTNHIELRVNDDALEIAIPMRGKTLPYAALKLDEARRVDLGAQQDLEPVRRTNGSDFGGLRHGWFVLRSGEKAYVILTNSQDAIYIPTREGYALLVSPPNSAAFLAKLKESAKAGHVPGGSS